LNTGEKTQTNSIANNKRNRAPILWTIDYSPDGKFYAIGGDDKLLRIYEATDFKLLKTYKLPTAIQCLDWNPNGNLLAIASDDNTTQLFNIETKQFFKLGGPPGQEHLHGTTMVQCLPLETMKAVSKSGIKRGTYLEP